MLLTATDTVSSLATARRAAAAEARAARIRGSKTSMEYLQNAGVIITEDDAFDNAMRYQGIAERAKARGTTFAEEEERTTREQVEDNVRMDLRRAVKDNETYAEHSARRKEALAQAVGTMANGKRCAHRSTQKNLAWVSTVGWFNLDARDALGNEQFKCCRCNATATVGPMLEPTEQAKLATLILAKES